MAGGQFLTIATNSPYHPHLPPRPKLPVAVEVSTNKPTGSRQIVTLRKDADLDGLLKELGINPRHKYRHAFNGFAHELDEKTIAKLKKDSRVIAVEADGDMMPAVLPGTIYGTIDLTKTQIDSTGITRMGLHSFPVRHQNGKDNRINVHVAVLDTGVAWDHPDLNVVDAEGFADQGWNGYDWSGHGTHVSGIIGALDNGFGVVGVAPGASIWDLQVIGVTNSSWANFIAACEFIVTNSDYISVANASIQGNGITQVPVYSVRQAIQAILAKGVVFVTSAGNGSQDIYGGSNGSFGVYDTNNVLISGSSSDYYPASAPEALCVSAMDPGFETFANFSNYSLSDAGSQTLLFSPGNGIAVAAPGVNIVSTYCDPSTNFALGYAIMSGTSMAAPHAAGLAALYIAANGRATNEAGVLKIDQTLINTGLPQSYWGTNTNGAPWNARILTSNSYNATYITAYLARGNLEPLAYPWTGPVRASFQDPGAGTNSVGGAAYGTEAWVPLPQFTSHKKATNGVQLSFNAVPGYNYIAQYTSSFSKSNQWTGFSTNAGSGYVTNVTVIVPSTNLGTRFYRLLRQPAP